MKLSYIKISGIRAILALAIVFSTQSCDKIEPGEDGTYTVYSGSVGEWEDGEPVADHTQRVWIEKYTGPRCTNCPTADESIHDITAQPQYSNKVIATAIHATNIFGTPIGDSPNLRTEEGDAWCLNFLGSSAALPSALLNRQKDNNSIEVIQDFSALSGKVNAILTQSATVAIALSSHFDSQADKISITTNIELLDDVADDLTLTVLIIEDSIVATQRMPDGSENSAYIHNHVLRGMVTDKWGFDIDSPKTRGAARKVTLRASLPEGCIMEHCQTVAFVSDKSSRSIYNVAISPIL